MSPDSGSPEVERETKGEAEYVEGGSGAKRSGTVQHSREHLSFGLGFGPKETSYTSEFKRSETYSLPKRPSQDTNTFHKKAKQNSSELAEPRRLPTACFGLNEQQETELYATQVVDSHTENDDCGAKAGKAKLFRRHKRQNAS